MGGAQCTDEVHALQFNLLILAVTGAQYVDRLAEGSPLSSVMRDSLEQCIVVIRVWPVYCNVPGIPGNY